MVLFPIFDSTVFNGKLFSPQRSRRKNARRIRFFTLCVLCALCGEALSRYLWGNPIFIMTFPRGRGVKPGYIQICTFPVCIDTYSNHRMYAMVHLLEI